MNKIIASILIIAFFTINPGILLNNSIPGIFRAILHNFLHDNIFHLLSNLFVFIIIYRNIRKDKLLFFLVSTIIASISFSVSRGNSIGLSDVVYATVGLLSPPFRSPWWKKRSTLFFIIVTLLSLTVPFISGLTHIFSLITGIFVARIRGFLKSIKDDFSRARGNNKTTY